MGTAEEDHKDEGCRQVRVHQVHMHSMEEQAVDNNTEVDLDLEVVAYLVAPPVV